MDEAGSVLFFSKKKKKINSIRSMHQDRVERFEFETDPLKTNSALKTGFDQDYHSIFIFSFSFLTVI